MKPRPVKHSPLDLLKAIAVALFAALLPIMAQADTQSRLDSLIALSKNAAPAQQPEIFNELSWMMRNTDTDSALAYGKRALAASIATGNHFEQTRAYSFIGVCHRNLTHYSEALKSYTEGLEHAKTYGYKDQIAYFHIDIGNLYIYHSDYERAKTELETALATATELNDSMILSFCHLNLGRVALETGRFKESHKHLDKSLEIRKAIGAAPTLVAVVEKYIGDAFMNEKKYKIALFYYSEAVADRGELRDNALIAGVYLNMTNCYLCTHQTDSALVYARRCLEVSKLQDSKLSISRAHRMLGKAFEAAGDLQSAVEQYGIVMTFGDSAMAKATSTRLANIEYQLDKLKKEREIDLMKKKQELRQTYAVAGVFILITLTFLVIVLVKKYRQKERDNMILEIQRDEIATKNKEIVQQHDILEQQNKDLEAQRKMLIAQQKEITDSIVYARRIQFAILPHEEMLREYFSDSFILYRPRDVVSGDFYWMFNDSKSFCLVVADCTGHGVPGAFMSMLGIAALSEIIVRDGIRQSGEVLNRLRERLKEMLHQNIYDKETTQDGMDAALVIIDRQTNVLEYAGAFIPLLCIRNDQDMSINATRNPIGVYVSEVPFESNRFELKKGDKLYMTSDGYSSQFGGPENKKLKPSGYKKVIMENSDKPMAAQCAALEKTLDEWQGSNEQTDDILVVGVKI